MNKKLKSLRIKMHNWYWQKRDQIKQKRLLIGLKILGWDNLIFLKVKYISGNSKGWIDILQMGSDKKPHYIAEYHGNLK